MLAFTPANRYLVLMLIDTVRRIAAVLVALGLLFGPAAGSMHASSMSAKMVMSASNGTHSSGDCNDCGTAKAGMPIGACSAIYCGGLIAYLTADDIGSDWLPAKGFTPRDSRHVSGHVGPPDPYPPKPTILD